MRRTAAIRLTLLSAASLALVACGDDPAEADTMFLNEAACVSAYGEDGRAACQASFAAAAAEHAATAPHFPDQAACEAQTGGSCEMTGKPGIASYAIPVMAGVLIGRALSDAGGVRPVMPLYAGRPPLGAGCAPGSPAPECQPQRSSSNSTTSSRFNWYYGGSHIGSTASTASDVRPMSTSAAGAMAVSRVAGMTAGGSGSISRGGLGAAGRSFASVGS